MDFVQLARTTKHQAFLAKQRTKQWVYRTDAAVWDAWDARRPYHWNSRRYGDAWFASSEPRELSVPEEAPHVLWLIWSGTNPMTPNRAARLQDLRDANPDLEIILVTPSNIGDFLVPGHPLHPAYENLSLVHRSDYLRCYLLHHHGGAYSDIKACRAPLMPNFKALSDPNIWLVTYGEPIWILTARMKGSIGRDLRTHRRKVPGQAVMISRPRTPLTSEWYAEMTRRLDRFAPQLRREPGGVHGAGVKGTPASNPRYPLHWADLLSQIYHPLGLKYHDHVHFEPTMFPSLSSYR